MAVVVIELWIAVTTTAAYALPEVPGLDARLRRAGTSFLAKQSLQTKHTTGNASGQQATVTSDVFGWKKLSVDSEIVAGL